MPRHVRVEYAGAIYHGVAWGDRGESILVDDQDREQILRTLGQACAKTGWRIHAWVLMSNYYHWLVETPQPNLVEGMRWMQNTYTRRLNHRQVGNRPLADFPADTGDSCAAVDCGCGRGDPDRRADPQPDDLNSSHNSVLTHRVAQELFLGHAVNVAGNQGGCFDNMC